jgi:hypothetical protein
VGHALTKKRAKRGKQPHSELLRPFTTVSVQLSWKPKRTTNVRVTSATVNELPAITALLCTRRGRRLKRRALAKTRAQSSFMNVRHLAAKAETN